VKEIRTGFPTREDAQKEASRLGLSGYIISGPKADGTWSIKVLTRNPVQEGTDA